VASETSTYRTEITSRLRSATDDLAWAVRGLTSAKLAYTPSAEEWAIHEHIAHVRDMEQEVYLPLLRWATVPEMLDPLDYHRQEWHEHRYRSDEPIVSIVNEIARIRDEELAIFRDMTDSTWTRYRTDTRWGPLTCQWLAELMYRHALDHLQLGTRFAVQVDPIAARADTVAERVAVGAQVERRVAGQPEDGCALDDMCLRLMPLAAVTLFECHRDCGHLSLLRVAVCLAVLPSR